MLSSTGRLLCVSTGSSFLISVFSMVPETPALISLNTFIASTIQTTVSAVTLSPTSAKGGESGSDAA